MANVAQKINASIGITATTLYTAFTGSGTRAVMASVDFCNTTTADITIDFYKEVSGPTDYYIYKTMTVPAKDNLAWRGLITLDTAGDLIRAIASATGVDATGTVFEA